MSNLNLTGEVYFPSNEVLKHAHAKCNEIYKPAEVDLEGF